MFKFLTQKDRLLHEGKQREALQASQEKVEVASSIAFVTLAETGTIDEVTKWALAHGYKDGLTLDRISNQRGYEPGNIRSYEENLYRCVQAHTSQDDWTPDKVPALWTKIGDPTVEFPEWSQPIGSHDAYAKGDKVSHNDKHWESTVDGNVWQPGVYGWDEV